MSSHHKTKAETDAAEVEDKSVPKHGTAVKADANGPLPRVLGQNERSPDPDKFARVKVEARNYLPQPRRYVLVQKGKDDEATAKAAREFYTNTATTLGKQLAQIKANGTKEDTIVQPDIVTTVLPD